MLLFFTPGLLSKDKKHPNLTKFKSLDYLHGISAYFETFATIFWYLEWLNQSPRLLCLFGPEIYTEWTKLTWAPILSKTIKCWSTFVASTSNNVFLTLALTTIFITNSWFWASGVTVTFFTNATIEWIHWNGFHNAFALWQYRLWSFNPGIQNQHAKRKLLNFENWCSSKLSKTGHHFSNKATQKLMLSKN